MTTTTATPATAPARERNEAVWRQSSTALYAKQVQEFLACWHPDGRYEVAYPIEGMPSTLEGQAALAEVFAGFCAAAERIEVNNVRFHQTDDPDVAFVEEHMQIDLVDGGRYENDLIIRVTFRDGLIAEMFEYYGEHAHEQFLRRLGITG